MIMDDVRLNYLSRYKIEPDGIRNPLLYPLLSYGGDEKYAEIVVASIEAGRIEGCQDSAFPQFLAF
jgi:hypothetical protein